MEHVYLRVGHHHIQHREEPRRLGERQRPLGNQVTAEQVVLPDDIGRPEARDGCLFRSAIGTGAAAESFDFIELFGPPRTREPRRRRRTKLSSLTQHERCHVSEPGRLRSESPACSRRQTITAGAADGVFSMVDTVPIGLAAVVRARADDGGRCCGTDCYAVDLRRAANNCGKRVVVALAERAGLRRELRPQCLIRGFDDGGIDGRCRCGTPFRDGSGTVGVRPIPTLDSDDRARTLPRTRIPCTAAPRSEWHPHHSAAGRRPRPPQYGSIAGQYSAPCSNTGTQHHSTCSPAAQRPLKSRCTPRRDW